MRTQALEPWRAAARVACRASVWQRYLCVCVCVCGGYCRVHSVFWGNSFFGHVLGGKIKVRVLGMGKAYCSGSLFFFLSLPFFLLFVRQRCVCGGCHARVGAMLTLLRSGSPWRCFFALYVGRERGICAREGSDGQGGGWWLQGRLHTRSHQYARAHAHTRNTPSHRPPPHGGGGEGRRKQPPRSKRRP